jgi:ferrochelatase
MANNCQYLHQLNQVASLVADRVASANWQLVFQSRSGPPTQPWLEPDIGNHLRALRKQGVEDVVISPIGFISDHMEVIYDLDKESKRLGDEIGLHVERAATVGTDQRFIEMIRLLIEERLHPAGPKLSMGEDGIPQDLCPVDCCRYN